MKQALFNNQWVVIIILCLLYIVTVFSSLDILRFHEEAIFNTYQKVGVSNPWVSYPLLAIVSLMFFVLVRRKGLDVIIKKTFILVYVVTVVTILILYKFNILMMTLILNYTISGTIITYILYLSFIPCTIIYCILTIYGIWSIVKNKRRQCQKDLNQ